MSLSLIHRHRSALPTGPLAALLEACRNRLPQRWLAFGHFFLMSCDRCDVPVKWFPAYRVRPLDPAELPDVRGLTFSPERARRELHEGSVCLAVRKGDAPVAWQWGATGKLFVRHCNTVVDTGDYGYYTYRLETVRQERLKGHVNACLRAMHAHFASLGRPLNFAMVSAWNGPGRRMHERCGYQPLGEIYTLTLFGWRLCYHARWPFPNKRLSVFRRVPTGAREV